MEAVTGAAAQNAQALVTRAASGDELAFARIVAEHHEDMRRVCAVVCGDDVLAEDAVQSAWPIAWRKLHSIRDPERLRPWLVSVAVNEAKQLIRKHRRRSKGLVTVLRITTGPEGWDLHGYIIDGELPPPPEPLLSE